jgi:hypothetical protein
VNHRGVILSFHLFLDLSDVTQSVVSTIGIFTIMCNGKCSFYNLLERSYFFLQAKYEAIQDILMDNSKSRQL